MTEIYNKEIKLPDEARVRILSRRLIKSVANLEAGVTEDEMNWLANGREAFQLVNRLKESGRKPNEKEKSTLEAANIDLDATDDRDAFVSAELLDALHATFIMINQTDPKKTVDNEYQGPGYVDIGTRANLEFLDFFVKVHQRFDLSDRNVYQLMRIIFEEEYLDEELEMRGNPTFPRGVIGAVNGYLELVRVSGDGWKFNIPQNPDLDKLHSVDLVGTSPRGTIKRYYELKGNIHQDEVNIIKLTRKKDLDDLLDYYIPSTGLKNDEQGRWRMSAERLHDFVASENAVGGKIKHRAYFVSAPSTIPPAI